jgi:hypothetical protein
VSVLTGTISVNKILNSKHLQTYYTYKNEINEKLKDPYLVKETTTDILIASRV